MTPTDIKKHPTLELLQEWLEATEGENFEFKEARHRYHFEKIAQETQTLFTTHDFVVLDHIHREEAVPESLKHRLQVLLENGALERISRNRYVLAKRFYSMSGKKGVYTRKKGLDRETNKQLLLKHIKDNMKVGAKMEELLQILPNHSRGQIRVLLRDLRSEGAIRCVGIKKNALWFPER